MEEKELDGGVRLRVADTAMRAGNGASLRRIGFGAARLCGPDAWGSPADPAAAIRLLRRAVELGVNFIDTADSYGPGSNEETISRALHPYDGIVLATKGGFERTGPGDDGWILDARPERLRLAVEGSLRRLRVERISLYQLHRIDPAVPFDDQLGTLRELQLQGKVEHIGLSQVTVSQIERARRVVRIASVQNLYNVAVRGSEAVLHLCERNGLCFIPWYPLGMGALATDNGELACVAAELSATPSQVALAWILHKSKATVAIPGTASTAHLEENLKAADLRLSREQMDRLDKLDQVNFPPSR